MSTEELFEEVAAWALRQDQFITSLQLCDQFHVSLTVAGRLIRKLITHPRITAEFKRERCIISSGQVKMMVMVRVDKIATKPFGPPKPQKAYKPKVAALPKPKDDVVIERLKKLVLYMPAN
ncbi:hypothetical protein [Aeromonas veronii]|uniref:hypothetical protein n=1 Tax=Aeromonas veronii TaxID=654 RepID=UPI003BA15D9F